MSKTASTALEKGNIFSELDNDILGIRCRLDDILALNAAMYSILDRLLEHDKARSDTDILCTLVRIQKQSINTTDEALIAFWDKVPLDRLMNI